MPTRRAFLRLSAAATAAGVIGGFARPLPALEGADRRRALDRPLGLRDLGKTGRKVTCLGLGAFYLGSLRDEEAAVGIVRRAVELGVTYFDTAPSYNGGVSERRVGKGLEGARDRVFLATKSTCRDGAGAVAELEESLGRLRTDRVDLFQFHALRTGKDVDAIFGAGGAYASLAAAKKAGKVRHIGFTGHFDPELMARVCREMPVETVLLPLNCLDPHERSFGKGTLPAAAERGLGVVAMKVFVSGRLVEDAAGAPTVEECLRYVLGLPVATAIVGCSSVAELEEDVAVAKAFEPLTAEQAAALLERTRPLVARKMEWYKR